MTAAVDPATLQPKTQGAKCHFCHGYLPHDLRQVLSDGCPTCAASWRDQYIAELLMGFECLDGVRSFSRLSQALEQRNRRIAVIGRLFKREETEIGGHCQQFSIAQLRKVTRRRMRLPVQSGSLDYLLVSDAESMIFSLDEAARVLKDNGVLAVFWTRGAKPEHHDELASRRHADFSFNAPLVELSEKAGLIGWLESPGLGVSRVQRLQTFVAIKPPTAADDLADSVQRTKDTAPQTC